MTSDTDTALPQLPDQDQNNRNADLIAQAKDKTLSVDEGQKALNTLLAEYKQDVYQYAISALGSHEKADEAAQETLIWAWQNIASAPPDPTRFKLWLLAACKNKNREVRRNLSSEMSVRPETTLVATWTSSSNYFPDERPPEFNIQAHLHLLPHKQRRCLELQLAGLSVPRIAKKLKMSRKSVHQNLYRARARLRPLRKSTPKK